MLHISWQFLQIQGMWLGQVVAEKCFKAMSPKMFFTQLSCQYNYGHALQWIKWHYCIFLIRRDLPNIKKTCITKGIQWVVTLPSSLCRGPIISPHQNSEIQVSRLLARDILKWWNTGSNHISLVSKVRRGNQGTNFWSFSSDISLFIFKHLRLPYLNCVFANISILKMLSFAFLFLFT